MHLAQHSQRIKDVQMLDWLFCHISELEQSKKL